MIEAAEKYDRIVQVGFQNRSIENVRKAMQFLHDGGIGEVFEARGLCFKPRDSFGIAADSMPPASLDYNLWLGPAPFAPYCENRTHYNFRHILDYSGSMLTDWGAHQLDIDLVVLVLGGGHQHLEAAGGSLGIGLQLGRFLAIAGARVLLSARSATKLQEAREDTLPLADVLDEIQLPALSLAVSMALVLGSTGMFISGAPVMGRFSPKDGSFATPCAMKFTAS